MVWHDGTVLAVVDDTGPAVKMGEPS